MCLSITEITFCSGYCRIANEGSAIAIQTNGCAHFARGGSHPVCDIALNGITRLRSSMIFPEIWCEEHKQLAPKIRGCGGGMNPPGVFRLVYQSIEEWISLGNFTKAEGYEVLRCQLLYQTDLNKYVNNSVKNMMAKLTSDSSSKTTPRPQKRKLEEAPQGQSADMSSNEKRVKLTPKTGAGRNITHRRSEIDAVPTPSTAVVNDGVVPLSDLDDLLKNGIEVSDILDLGDDALWAANPLDATDDKLLRELFGCDDEGKLDVPELFPSE